MFTKSLKKVIRSSTLPSSLGYSSKSTPLSSVGDFPRTLNDLNDSFRTQVLMLASELPPNAAYNTDPEYRARIEEIRATTQQYQTGGELPEIDYTKEEHEVWAKLYKKLGAYHLKYASEEYNEGKLLLEKAGVFKPDRIPNIRELSEFLEARNGVTLRPVVSIMNPREFLNSFAFKVFHCTQYIRHGRSVDFTEEPDLCHEYIGHAPMLVNNDFVDFAQELGMASLAASEEEMNDLTSIFWYTFEFGLCKEGNDTKVYGAGILPSATEMEACLQNVELHRGFDFNKICDAFEDIQYTNEQRHYFVAPSLKEVSEKIREFSSRMNRPFGLEFNSMDQRVDII